MAESKFVSKDPEKRGRSVANLKRGGTVAPAGNQRALKHGAFGAVAREHRMQYLAELTEEFPSATRFELLMQATRMVRLEMLVDYLDDKGVVRNRRTGDPVGVALLEERLRAASERQYALLTERERSKGTPPAQSLAQIIGELTSGENGGES